MLIGSLREIEEVFRSAWCRETCDESDLADWSPLNPSRGQCGVTALTLHDLFGGAYFWPRSTTPTAPCRATTGGTVSPAA